MEEHINSQSEKIGFGNKTENFLRKKSRQAVEQYSGTPLLYFEVDYERSRKNFYGEILTKEWIDPNGTIIYGTISLTENSDKEVGGLPLKLLTLKFSCYIEQLKELGIFPKIGNYFATKNEFYVINDKTLLDSNKHSINTDNEAIAIEFLCTQVDNETLNTDVVGKITANELLGRSQKIDDLLTPY